ncbi:MAG: PAS domain-containing protein [Anaerolineae bacterium]|nr:PAS domain-containing protein [Anaerolineae bacterium]
MNWQFTPYAVPLLLGAVMLIILAVMAWQRRRTPGVIYYFFICALLPFYVVGYAFELGAQTPEAALSWLKLEYLGVVTSTPLMLMIALAYTNRQRYLTPLTQTLLLAVPVMTIMFVWTNELHNLQWVSLTQEFSGGFSATIFERGPWYWFQLGYSYLLAVIGVGLLAQALRKASGLQQRRLTAILIGASMPLVSSLLYVIGLSPTGLDLTPYGYIIGAIALAIGTFQYQLFDVMPIAQEMVLSSMDDALIVTDTRHRIIDLNPAAQQLIGGDRAEVASRFMQEALPEHLAAILDYTRATDRQEAELTFQINGGERCFDLRHYPLYRRGGLLSGHLVILRDITERKAHEAEREHLIGELDAFAHTVAHDLKTPLTVMSGYLYYLRETAEQVSAEEKREFLDAIAGSADKMGNIISELLLLASVRKQEDVPRRALPQMQTIVDEAIRRVRPMIQEMKAEVKVQPKEWPVALGHAPWIEEVWANYLSNALKYGGTPPRVMVGADALPEGMVRFWVRDNGPGLSADEQSKLFAQFTRLHKTRTEGHGLGLSIVQRIVERLGGEVGVESTPGQGSTFYFSLPAAPIGPVTGGGTAPGK